VAVPSRSHPMDTMTKGTSRSSSHTCTFVSLALCCSTETGHCTVAETGTVEHGLLLGLGGMWEGRASCARFLLRALRGVRYHCSPSVMFACLSRGSGTAAHGSLGAQPNHQPHHTLLLWLSIPLDSW
jgi:hypothetical protein